MNRLLAACAIAAVTAGPASAADWYAPDNRGICLVVRDNFMGATTPEQVRDLFAANGSYYTLDRPSKGIVILDKMNEDVSLIFFEDKGTCHRFVAARADDGRRVRS